MDPILYNEDRQFDINGFRTRRGYLWNRLKSITSERARLEAAKKREAVARYRLKHNDFTKVGRSQSKKAYKKMMEGIHDTKVNTSREHLEKVFKRRTGENIDKYATVHHGLDKLNRYIGGPIATGTAAATGALAATGMGALKATPVISAVSPGLASVGTAASALGAKVAGVTGISALGGTAAVGALGGAAVVPAAYFAGRAGSSLVGNTLDKIRRWRASKKHKDIKSAHSDYMKARKDSKALYAEMRKKALASKRK